MTMHQETENSISDRKEQTNPAFEDLALELEKALTENKRDLEKAETAFESADEDAFHATVSAEESEKAYQANHELLQTLRAEEENMRNATELASALASDASSAQTNRNTNYSELLNQAMSALHTVSSNAKQELAAKQQQREKAEYADQQLRLKSASSQLSAYLAFLRRAKAEHNRLHATNSLNLIENQHKLAQTRNELSKLLETIARQREFLEESLSGYYQAIQQVEKLGAEEVQHREKLEQLNERLSATSMEIIPHESLLNDLRHEEGQLKDAFGKAEKEALLAAEQEKTAAEALEEANKQEEIWAQSGEQQMAELLERNSKMLQEVEQNLQAASAAFANATDLAEQAHLELERHEAQIPLQESENSIRKEALEKARNAAGETARMVVNVQVIKSAMHGNSSGALSSAEAVLQNTLQTTNDMVEEKQRAFNESKQQLEEMKEASRFLQQAVEEAEQAKNALQLVYNGVNSDHQRILEQTRRSESQLQSVSDQKLNEAHLQRLSASESWESARKRAAEKQKIADELREQLNVNIHRSKEAVQARDQMQKQINELNARIEMEKIQSTNDREKQVIHLWESSKELHLHAKETGQHLKHNIENAQRLSHQEQRLASSLKRIIREANEAFVALYAKNSRKLSNTEQMIEELKQALEEYRHSPFLKESSYDETLYTASKILSSMELSNGAGLKEPEVYKINVGENLYLAPELIMRPIPQVEGDAEIKLDPFDVASFSREHDEETKATVARVLEAKKEYDERLAREEARKLQEEEERKAQEEARKAQEEQARAAEEAAAAEKKKARENLLEELRALVKEPLAPEKPAPKPVKEKSKQEQEAEEELNRMLKDIEALKNSIEKIEKNSEIDSIEESEAAAPPQDTPEVIKDESMGLAEEINSLRTMIQAHEEMAENQEEAAEEEQLTRPELQAEEEQKIEESPVPIEEAIILPESSVVEAEEDFTETAQTAETTLISKEEQTEESAPLMPLFPEIPELTPEDIYTEVDESPEEALPAESDEAEQEESADDIPVHDEKPSLFEFPAPAPEKPSPLYTGEEDELLPEEEAVQPALPSEVHIRETPLSPESPAVEEAALILEDDIYGERIDDEHARSLANEIDSLRSLIGSSDGSLLSTQKNTSSEITTEAKAQQESERLRREEEEAQKRAEELAAAEAERERKAAEEEAARLTRLAEEAAARITQSQQTAENSIQSNSQTAHTAKEENEDDLEAELRRLIFSSFK
ncbi:MAG: hypothetical protein Q4B50_04035 [Bacillota bacterium]|nr:hypothetical protein [Bacillota bacterium]